MANFKRCNKCGAEFEPNNYGPTLSIDTYMGYGSVHDGDRFTLDLCMDCADEFVKNINEMLKFDVIVDDDID